MFNDTTRLLGLAGLAVTGVADGPDGPVVDLVTADEQARRCPECGTLARRSKGWRVTRPRNLPVGGRALHGDNPVSAGQGFTLVGTAGFEPTTP
ncbi:transposase family protein [Micromonospora sp. U21]|uniref:transposase family protein n=1 Tax=Micromonospora sp. U21 TaxID=2824899 RepID=UPI001B3923E2|nr:transposase family protein [Micromonospora sp. U21]MBQ0905320.1 transposase family protein [Micromonospora sp. U21]